MDKLSANFLNTPAHPPSSASAPGAEAGRSTDALRSAEAPATHRAMEALSLLRDAGRQQADWIKAMKKGSRQDRAGLQIPQRCGELPLPKNAERQCLNGILAPRRPGTQPSISRLESVEGVREEIQRRRRDREETRGQDMQQRLRDEIVTLKAEIQRHELKAREHTQQIHELEAALEATGDKCAALTKKIGEMKQRYHQRILDLEAQLQEGLKGQLPMPNGTQRMLHMPSAPCYKLAKSNSSKSRPLRRTCRRRCVPSWRVLKTNLPRPLPSRVTTVVGVTFGTRPWAHIWAARSRLVAFVMRRRLDVLLQRHERGWTCRRRRQGWGQVAVSVSLTLMPLGERLAALRPREGKPAGCRRPK